jgi:hypothetical protein
VAKNKFVAESFKFVDPRSMLSMFPALFAYKDAQSIKALFTKPENDNGYVNIYKKMNRLAKEGYLPINLLDIKPFPGKYQFTFYSLKNKIVSPSYESNLSISLPEFPVPPGFPVLYGANSTIEYTFSDSKLNLILRPDRYIGIAFITISSDSEIILDSIEYIAAFADSCLGVLGVTSENNLIEISHLEAPYLFHKKYKYTILSSFKNDVSNRAKIIFRAFKTDGYKESSINKFNSSGKYITYFVTTNELAHLREVKIHEVNMSPPDTDNKIIIFPFDEIVLPKELPPLDVEYSGIVPKYYFGIAAYSVKQFNFGGGTKEYIPVLDFCEILIATTGDGIYGVSSSGKVEKGLLTAILGTSYFQ